MKQAKGLRSVPSPNNICVFLLSFHESFLWVLQFLSQQPTTVLRWYQFFGLGSWKSFSDNILIFNLTLCWFSIRLSCCVNSLKDGLVSGSLCQQFIMIWYLKKRGFHQYSSYTISWMLPLLRKTSNSIIVCNRLGSPWKYEFGDNGVFPSCTILSRRDRWVPGFRSFVLLGSLFLTSWFLLVTSWLLGLDINRWIKYI